MPNPNASTWLELPALPGVSGQALQALNDRFRTIAAGMTPAAAAAKSPVSTSSSSGGQVALSVPGTLGVQTNAAALIALETAATPVGLLAMLKQPPQGNPVVVNVLVAGSTYTSVTLPAGSSAVVVITGSLGGAITANAVITLNITQVGTTFPGSDLSVLLRF
jgi:hypothetical protein